MGPDMLFGGRFGGRFGGGSRKNMARMICGEEGAGKEGSGKERLFGGQAEAFLTLR